MYIWNWSMWMFVYVCAVDVRWWIFDVEKKNEMAFQPCVFGIYLPVPVFSHGQLYAALSCTRIKENLKVLLKETSSVGMLVVDKFFFYKTFGNKRMIKLKAWFYTRLIYKILQLALIFEDMEPASISNNKC